MTYMIVPHVRSESSVSIWVGRWVRGRRPAAYELVVRSTGGYEEHRSWSNDQWVRIGEGEQGGVPGCQSRTYGFRNLPPNAAFTCYLNSGSSTLATASFETPPDSLANDSLRIMLGSCYSVDDDYGQLAASYESLFQRREWRPHLKLLLGDQVYVDQPAVWWSWPRSRREVMQATNRRYYKTWQSLEQVLTRGCNALTTDDHEYWNDYPFGPLRVPWVALQDTSNRNALKASSQLFARHAQGVDAPTRTVTIGDDLSIMIAETRYWRSSSGFTTPTALQQLKRWIRGLSTPGVLVLGQPMLWSAIGHVEVELDSTWNWLGAAVGLFAGGIPSAIAGALAPELAEGVAEGAAGEISDRNLPFFKMQYRSLAAAICQSRHDILVLAGDIHLGRIARSRIHNDHGTDPVKFYEVTSSPLAVLDTARAEVNLQDLAVNPRLFPPHAELRARDVWPGLVDYPHYLPESNGQTSRNHFMTLRFKRGPEAGTVEVDVTAWLTDPPPRARSARSAPPLPRRAWNYTFQLDAGRLPTDGSVPTRLVTHVVTNLDGDVLGLANPHATWSPRTRREAVRDISLGLARYVTETTSGSGEDIHVVRDHSRNLEYLRTDHNAVWSDNLGSLPRIDSLVGGEWHQ